MRLATIINPRHFISSAAERVRGESLPPQFVSSPSLTVTLLASVQVREFAPHSQKLDTMADDDEALLAPIGESVSG